MTDTNKKRLLYVVSVVAGLVIIWLLLQTKAGKNIINKISSGLNLPEINIPGIGNFGKHSLYDLPSLPEFSGEGGSSNYYGCSMCSNSNVDLIKPAAPPNDVYEGPISPEYLLPGNVKKIKYDDSGNIKKIKFYAPANERETRHSLRWV